MGFFSRASRESADYNDPLLDDAAWIEAGESRYNKLISNHYGSPDTIAVGGDMRTQAGDVAAAMFFYQKAIDTLHSIYVCGFNDSGPGSWSRSPSPRDQMIADRYVGALSSVRKLRPSAPINRSVIEVTHRMRAISTQFERYGLDRQPYLDRLSMLADIAPDVDVSGVFWS